MTGFSGTGLACRRSERIIFDRLDFAAAPGGALVLTGPNGSGKSSLLRLMAGLIKPFAGRLDWDDAPVSADPASHRERVAYLGHRDALKLALTTAENVRLWPALRGKADSAEAALGVLHLSDFANLPARFLSSGQSRRAALARTIAAAAPLWLLDEPTVGLDSASIAALEGALAAHRHGGGIVIAATHAPFVLPGAATLDLADFAADLWADQDRA